MTKPTTDIADDIDLDALENQLREDELRFARDELGHLEYHSDALYRTPSAVEREFVENGTVKPEPKSGGRSRPIRNLSVIAEMLIGGPISDFGIQGVKRWFRRSPQFAPMMERIYDKRKKRLGKVCAELSEADRMAIGKFIASEARMSFEAGLRIGLSVSCAELLKEDS